MKDLYFISITTDNTLRALQRMASIFSRNQINIVQLTVFKTMEKNMSHFNLVIYIESRLIEKIVKQLEKIIECQEIYACAAVKTKTT